MGGEGRYRLTQQEVCVCCVGCGEQYGLTLKDRGAVRGLSLEGRWSKKLTLGGTEARGSPQIHNRRRRG